MTALARRTDVPVTLADQMQLCKTLAESQLLPGHLAGKPANLLAIMYAAQAIDVPIWQAVQSMHVVNGKVGMSADLMRALVQRAGHRFRVVESEPESATVEIERADDAGHPQRFSFTRQDAEVAGLWGTSTWKKYPKALLLARATTGACRLAAADALNGMTYSPEELGGDLAPDDIPEADGRTYPVAGIDGATGEQIADEVGRSSDPNAPPIDVTDPSNVSAIAQLGETAETGSTAERSTGRQEDAWTVPLPVEAKAEESLAKARQKLAEAPTIAKCEVLLQRGRDLHSSGEWPVEVFAAFELDVRRREDDLEVGASV